MSKRATITHWKEQIAADPRWAQRALLRIYEQQTADERREYNTRYANSVGFSGVDAEVLTSLAQWLQRTGSLTEKQNALLCRKMPKYAGQLYKLTCS